MKTKILPLLLFILAASWRLSASAYPGSALWTNYYRGDVGGSDEPLRLAVDSDRNVYVAGMSSLPGRNWQFTLIAYSPSGISLWTNFYNHIGDSQFYPQGLAADAGQIYAAGYSGGSFITSFDYTVIAFSTAGESLWTNRYDGAAHATDWPSDIAVDTNNGNLYVTGNSFFTDTDNDFLTIAYSSGGTPLWINRFGNKFPDQPDQASALAVAADGTVFVTGQSGEACVTLAYSPNGTLLWTNFFNAGEYSTGGSLCVDQDGNVYVAAGTQTTERAYDFAILAYSHSGTPLWTNFYNGPDNSDDLPAQIAADSFGHVYVTGSSDAEPGVSSYVTLAYSRAGTSLWTNIYQGANSSFNESRALALDGSGNVYVTGDSSDGNKLDIATIAYSGSGKGLWTNRFNTPNLYDTETRGIKVDSNGDVIVLGRAAFDIDGNPGFVTIKYAGQPQQPLPIPLQIHQTGNIVQLTWSDPTFHLESSASLTGIFTNLPGATSPYSTPITGPQQFFRLHHE